MEIEVDSQTVYINTGGMDWSDGQPWLCLVHGASLDLSLIHISEPTRPY